MNNDRIYYSHEAEMHAVRTRIVFTVVLLALGLGIGAVLALLLSPTTGKTARHDLIKGVEEGLNTGREAVKPVLKHLEEQVDDFRKGVEERLK